MPKPRYQPFYCEENIWQLCQRDDFAEDAYVVFISNAHKTCALWTQHAARAPGGPVLWDYHVILVDDSKPTTQVWDLDSLVGAPAPFERWWQATFPLEDMLPEQFQPYFRVIPADVFVATFSSDRSHMRDEEGEWRAEPPPWDPILQDGVEMNLESFIDLQADSIGQVMERDEFRRRFSSDF